MTARIRSIRTSGAVVVAVVAVSGVAVLTHDATLTGLVAGFAGTALGLLTGRHTAEDLARSRPAKSPDAPR